MASRQELQDDAVAKLKKFIPGISKRDYINYILAGGVDGAANTNNSPTGLEGIEKALDPIVNLVNGGKFLYEILIDLEGAMAVIDNTNFEVNEKIATFVRVTPSQALLNNFAPEATLIDIGVMNGTLSFLGDAGNTIKHFRIKSLSDSDPVPSKTNTSLVAIEMLNPKIGVSVRDTSALQVFCSMIPPHAISRAVPYVSAKIYTPHMVSSNGSETITESLNLIRYLKGNVAYKKEDTLGAMIFSMTGSAGAMGSGPTKGGMELFTAPQTMVSDPSDPTSNFGSYKPIDRFRPLMTLNDINIDVTSAGAGMMSYKQASMNITLHDRGRLAEITPLVKPGMYSFVEVELEYGWSADPRSGNAKASDTGELTGFATQDDVFTQFVDSLRVKEKYQVVNSTFKFDDVGQVNISITLAMKGSSDMRAYDISDDGMKAREIEIKKLVEDIQTLLAKNGEKTQTLFGETLLNAVASPEAALALDNKALTKVKEAITKLKANTTKRPEAFTELNNSMDALFNTKTIADFKTGAQDSVTKTFTSLKSEDEIFPASRGIYESKTFTKSELTNLGCNDFAQISLGRVLLAFVGAPLAKSGQYDEIQFIFNKMNSRAGFVRGLSTAAFPLDRDKLETKLKDLYSKNLSISLSNFIGVIGETQFNNSAHKAYGFSRSYVTKDGKVELKDEKQQPVIDGQLEKAGIYDLNFQLPSLSVIPECVPHINDPTKTILRIHVMDDVCTPHQTYAEAINSARTDSAFFVDTYSLSSDNKLFPGDGGVYSHDLDPNVVGAERVADINKMITAGVLKSVGVSIDKEAKIVESATYNIDLTQLFTSGDPKIAKKFLSEALPTLRYGAAAGMIKSISLSSISDPALTTINTIKMDDAAGDEEGISRQKGLPLLIAPTEVTVEMMGCPIVNFGQSVYIDFGTNTTADNIYACTGLSHKLSPGDFSTSAKFTLNIGAYGIYNSAKRAFDITTAMVNAAAGGAALRSVLTDLVSSVAKKYKWGKDGDCFKDVDSKQLLAKSAAVKNNIGAVWSSKENKTVVILELKQIADMLKVNSESTFVFMKIPTVEASSSTFVGVEYTLVGNEQKETDVLIEISAWIKENEVVVAANKAARQAAWRKAKAEEKNEKEATALAAEVEAARYKYAYAYLENQLKMSPLNPSDAQLAPGRSEFDAKLGKQSIMDTYPVYTPPPAFDG